MGATQNVAEECRAVFCCNSLALGDSDAKAGRETRTIFFANFGENFDRRGREESGSARRKSRTTAGSGPGFAPERPHSKLMKNYRSVTSSNA
jgi:hypothetical protein